MNGRSETPVTQIGFIGVGAQGRPLALNILVAGYDLQVYDASQEAVQDLMTAGAVACDTSAQVARSSDIVFICVATDAQLLDVVNGTDGILSGAVPGLTVVIHSTVSPATIAIVAELASATGIDIVDAPVSGGPEGAQKRDMSFIVGGSREAIARCEPVFALSGQKITYTGGVGTATMAKLAHQVALCCTIVGVAEAMKIGAAASGDTFALQDVLCFGAAKSLVAECWDEPFFSQNAVALFKKDLGNALAWAKANGVMLPGAEVAAHSIESILKHHLGKNDA